MESFEIQIGKDQKKLKIEKIGTGTNSYKILDTNTNTELTDKDPLEIEDVPVSSELGKITVRSEKDFDFEGAGPFSGDELLGIAAQITLHPSFNNQNSGSQA